VHVASWREGYAGLVDPAILAAVDPGERAAAWQGYLGHVMTFVAERGGELAGFASLAIPARSLDEPQTGDHRLLRRPRPLAPRRRARAPRRRARAPGRRRLRAARALGARGQRARPPEVLLRAPLAG
jgi:hypothetical protein